jgi:DNA-binding CsgD family transcriptional regulator
VSVHTVHFHRRNIRRTLGIESDGGLIRFALLMELATDDEAAPAPTP